MEDNMEVVERTDENVASLWKTYAEMLKDADVFNAVNVPQQAAKDRMIEILTQAMYPYLEEYAQCVGVFEQGTE
ncbi:MAG: hypothetical protein M0P12_00975 [Paludibacteraceae bacterium]|jgi:hypothetical protein|nr:hypothetical protein [Paludibacteraceae bacterium]MCK9615188.1 hypothetical protein [Candidatus Omnitrophota bacterium]